MKQLEASPCAAGARLPLRQPGAAQPYALVDLGSGDGRFVQAMARSNPAWQVIGVDACREHVRRAERSAPPNATFLTANALDLPPALHGIACQITINFPWGSLARGIFDEHLGLLAQIAAIARVGAKIEIRVNAGALVEHGRDLTRGGEELCALLNRHSFRTGSPKHLDAAALRAFPSTWAKRLAFGRDPRGLYVAACYQGTSAGASMP